jgi:hypothetical protein
MMRRALLVAVFVTACLAHSRSAWAKSYVAPKDKVIVGVTGGRTVGGYVRAAGKPPGVFQFFVAWGDRFGYAYRRAHEAGAGLMVHLSTYNGPDTEERTTPRDIALGREDRYLYALGRDFKRYGRPVYLRLFSEMNNAANPYSAYDADGKPRGAAHAQYWFRQAWRRVDLVLKGGRAVTVDRRLRRLGMPRLRGRHGRRLARPHVALQWVPMTAGSPNLGGNRPAAYWPGGRYVDWIGTDFYSRELRRAEPLLRRAAVRRQAVRVRRVGDVGPRRPGVHASLLRLDPGAPAREDARVQPGQRPDVGVPALPLPARRPRDAAGAAVAALHRARHHAVATGHDGPLCAAHEEPGDHACERVPHDCRDAPVERRRRLAAVQREDAVKRAGEKARGGMHGLHDRIGVVRPQHDQQDPRDQDEQHRGPQENHGACDRGPRGGGARIAICPHRAHAQTLLAARGST